MQSLVVALLVLLPSPTPAAQVPRPVRPATSLIDLEVVVPEGMTVRGRPYCVGLPARDLDRPDREEPEDVSGSLRRLFDVVPGQRYAVGWIGERQLVEREVDVPLDGSRTPVVLRLERTVEPARLTVEVREPSGGRYALGELEELVLELRSPRTGTLIAERHAALTRPATLIVPAGEVVLAALPRHTPLMCIEGAAFERLWRCEERLRLSLVPGERRHVVLEPRLGGRVRLHLDLPDVVRDPRLVPAADEDAEHDRRFALFQLRERNPSAVVTEPGAGGRTLQFFIADDAAIGGLPFLLPGTAAVTETLLRPGSRTLLIEAPGFLPEAVRVDVVAGEVVDVRVRLRDR